MENQKPQTQQTNMELEQNQQTILPINPLLNMQTQIQNQNIQDKPQENIFPLLNPLLNMQSQTQNQPKQENPQENIVPIINPLLNIQNQANEQQQNEEDQNKQTGEKYTQLSIKNIKTVFRPLFAKFAQLQPTNIKYFHAKNSQFYRNINNLVLASKNQIKIYQIIQFEKDEKSQNYDTFKSVQMQLYNSYDIEGEIQNLEIFRNKEDPFSEYIILQFINNKISILQLDHKVSKSLKTINMYNFSNQAIKQRQTFIGKQQGTDILRADHHKKHAKYVGITTSLRQVLVILVYTKEITFPKEESYYKNFMLKFNADYFDCWSATEEQRLFGPSIYIDLKQDLNIEKLIDFVFDQPQNSGQGLSQNSIYLLDSKVKLKLDEENAGLQDALGGAGDKMEEENADQQNQIPVIYTQIVKVKIKNLLQLKKSEQSLLELNQCFRCPKIKMTMQHLPYDAYRLQSLENGSLLIFCKYFIICYQNETNDMKILCLQSIKKLEEEYEIKYLKDYLVENPQFIEEGIMDAKINILDQTICSIVCNKSIYLLYFYYDKNQYNTIQKMLLVKTTVDKKNNQYNLIESTNFQSQQYSYLYYNGIEFENSQLSFLKMNSELDEAQMRAKQEADSLFKLKNYKVQHIYQLEDQQNIIDQTSNSVNDFYTLKSGVNCKSELYYHNQHLNILENQKITQEFQVFKNVQNVFTVENYFLISCSQPQKTVILQRKQDNQIGEIRNDMFIRQKQTQAIVLNTFTSFQVTYAPQTQQQIQQNLPPKKSVKKKDIQLCIQICENIDLMWLGNQM